MAGFLNLLLPIVFVRIIVRRSLIARITLIGTFCAFVAVEYFASSRGGWLGGAIGLAVTTIALTWSHGRNWIRPMWHRSRGIALGAGIGVIAILGVAGAVVFELLSAQASMTQHAPVSSARAGVWAGTVDIVSRSPWVGHGPDSFVVRFAQVAHLPPGDTLNHAHNVVLELAAEGGVIAVLLALGASGVGIWCLLPSVRSALQRPDPALAAYLGSFTAMLVQHGVDFLLKVEPYLMTVMVLAALLMSRAGRRGLIRLPARLLAFGCVFTAGAVLVASLPSPAETSFYLRGIKDGEARDWTAARHGLCTAAEQAPWVSIYRFECALAIASDSAMGTQDARLEDAVREQQAGLALDPTWPVHRANLAGMEWAIGQREVAIEDMRQAVAQAPRHPLLAANLGQMLEQLGRFDEAVQAYHQALDSDPLLREAPFFASTPLRARVLSSFTPSIPQSEADRLVAEGRDAITRSDPLAALPLLTAAVEANPRSASALVWRAWAYTDLRQSRSAWRDVQTALFIDPRSPQVLGVSALVAQRLGRDPEALEFAQRLFRSLEDASQSTTYYAELYRRPFLPFDLAPQLTRLLPTIEERAALEIVSSDFQQRGQVNMVRAVDLLLGASVDRTAD